MTASLGPVTVLGAHILDVLGRPVESIPPGQGSARLEQIRATAAGTAAGTGVDLAKLGAQVSAVGAIGDDLIGDIVIAALARHGIDTSGLVRKNGTQTSATMLPIRPNGERPALHVPGATPLLAREDIDLDRVRASGALVVGGPDALGDLVTDGGLDQVVAAAKGAGALVAVDVLHPGSPADLDRLKGLLAQADWFLPNGDQLLALTGRDDLTQAVRDVLALGAGGVAVTLGADGCLVAEKSTQFTALPALEVEVTDTTGCGDGFTAGMLAGLLAGATPADAAWLGTACGALVATGLGSDAGIESLSQALGFLARTQPQVADRIAAAVQRTSPPIEGAGQ